ncbi:MAG: hypothetical protein LBU91_09010 [Bacteroidales bacterium]|jgi:N12 class adenine-specific DNA methylase|nr:hypothetical protein [Bacteroidales bacterium]
MAATIIQKKTKSLVKKSTSAAPKRLSKTAEFWLKYPKGIITILDHKAVLK